MLNALRLRIRFAKMIGAYSELHADDTLDGPQLGALIRIAQRDCNAVRAVAAGAADAVHIAFRLVRQVEIDDMRDAGNVDAARRDVGGDKYAHGTVAEAVQAPSDGHSATCCRV